MEPNHSGELLWKPDLAHVDDTGGWAEAKSRTGSTVRIYTCPHCSTRYLARLDRTATAPVELGMFEKKEKARKRADLDAENTLHSRLLNDIDPVPCPKCGRLGEGMLAEIQRRVAEQTETVKDRRLYLGGLLCSFCLYSIVHYIGGGEERDVLLLVLGTGIAAGIVGFGLLLSALRHKQTKAAAEAWTENSPEARLAAEQARALVVNVEEALRHIEGVYRELEQERNTLASKQTEFAKKRVAQLQQRLDTLTKQKQQIELGTADRPPTS